MTGSPIQRSIWLLGRFRFVMTELKVVCPSCDSRFKLTKQIEQVRCPKCQEVFCPEDHLAEPAREAAPVPPPLKRQKFSEAPATSPKFPAKNKPATAARIPESKESYQLSDGSDADAETDDLLPRRSVKSKKGKRSRKSTWSSGSVDEEGASQFMQFGGMLMVLGVGAFVLPLVGLQVKGLHRLGPQAQAIGGVALFLVGVLCFVVGLGKRHLGGGFSDLLLGFKRSYFAIGALVLLLVLLPLMAFPAIRMLKSVIPQGVPAPNIAQQPGQPAGQPGNQAHPPIPPGWIMGPNGTPIPPGAPGNPNANPYVSQQPVQPADQGGDQGHRPIPPGWVIGPNGVPIPPGAPGSPNRPSIGPGSFPMNVPGPPPDGHQVPVSVASIEQQFAELGPQRIVTVLVKGSNDSQEQIQLQKQLKGLDARINLSTGGGGGTEFVVRLAPVDNVNEFAAKINFGTVTHVDPGQRTISLEL